MQVRPDAFLEQFDQARVVARQVGHHAAVHLAVDSDDDRDRLVRVVGIERPPGNQIALDLIDPAGFGHASPFSCAHGDRTGCGFARQYLSPGRQGNRLKLGYRLAAWLKA